MTGVATTHPEYSFAKEIWATTRAASAGQQIVKAGRQLYLPGFIPDDEERYNQYLQRAYFMGVTGRTRDSLIGMVFRKAPQIDVPPQVEEILDNIDGAGQSINQIAKAASKGILEAGRHVFLVDYPQSGGVDAETEALLGLQPTIASYPSEALINWRFEGVQGKQKLTLAVLLERVEVDEANEFSHETENSYRVLRLRDGVYTQQLYGDSGYPITEEYAPTMAGGAMFDHIPLHIPGAENNLPDVDLPTLYDLAILNIAHYQTTADHRENLFIHGQLTMGVTSDLSADEFLQSNPNGLVVGARKGVFLGSNGSFHSVTAPESSSLRVALQDLEQQMIMIGARLIQKGGMAETAEAARIGAAGEASALDTLTNNLSEAIEAALEDVALFMGAPTKGITYRLNKDFWESELSPQALQAVMQARMQGVIGPIDAIHMIRQGRIQIDPEREDADILAEAATTTEILPESEGGIV